MGARLLPLVLYGAKYIILFPVFAYFWFAALTLILTLLSKDRSFSDILLIAFATVSAIRLAAYYNEELSRDMAKILPFAVLAIFLIDASFFKIAESLEALKEANDHRESIFYYLLFLIAVEFALRLILAVVAFLVSVRKRISQEPLADDSDGAPMPPPGEEPSQEDGDVGADCRQHWRPTDHPESIVRASTWNLLTINNRHNQLRYSWAVGLDASEVDDSEPYRPVRDASPDP